jgi:hypothetical protein
MHAFSRKKTLKFRIFAVFFAFFTRAAFGFALQPQRAFAASLDLARSREPAIRTPLARTGGFIAAVGF